MVSKFRNDKVRYVFYVVSKLSILLQVLFELKHLSQLVAYINNSC